MKFVLFHSTQTTWSLLVDAAVHSWSHALHHRNPLHIVVYGTPRSDPLYMYSGVHVRYDLEFTKHCHVLDAMRSLS